MVELRAELSLDRPADQDGGLRETDPHGLLVRGRDVAEELAELGAGQHLADAEDDHGQNGEADEIGGAEHRQRGDHKHRAHQHAGRGAHPCAQPGKEEAGEHDHAGIDVDDALRLNGQAILVHAEQESPYRTVRPARAEEEGHHGRGVHPILDVFGQHVPEHGEHQPPDGEDGEIEGEVGLLEFGQRLEDEAALGLAALAKSLLAGEPFSFAGLAIGEQEQKVAADYRGVDVEDILPGQQAHLQRDERADPAADIHGLVEDAPGHRAVAAVGGLDECALDARLEDRRARGQQHCAREEAPVTVKPRHHQIAQRFDNRRSKDGLLVAVTVGQAAGEDRDERLDEVPEQQQRAERRHRYAQPAR